MPAIHVNGKELPNPEQITNTVTFDIHGEVTIGDEVYVLVKKSELVDKGVLFNNTHLFMYSSEV